MKSRIKELDSVTVNKIAAGEVIDRPVSIVKELIENAIDAEATRIHITLKNGGKELIRINDNGHGFYKEDLKKAALRHATSKISSLEDLYNNDNFGFRGEALASVCHCAKLRIISKNKEEDTAFSIQAFQDSISELLPATHEVGSTIEVRDLFFNIPVREQFLKTAATETAYCLEICMHFALTHPEIDFVFSADEIERLNTSGIYDVKALAIHLFGNSLKHHLVDVHESLGPVKITGIISAPTLTFPNRQKQVVSVNNRLIKNSLIQKAILDAYRDRIPQRRFPLSILNITLQQSSVDVNVHPQKLDVKFLNPGFIFDVIPKALSLALQQHSSHTDLISSQVFPQATQAHTGFTIYEQHHSSDPFIIKNTPYTAETKIASQFFEPLSQQSALNFSQSLAPLEYLQVFNTYIILKSTQGVYMIDQHAVHERILYEQIKNSFQKEQARQLLLVPEIIDLSADLMTIFESEAQYFRDLNFICEEFGPSQIIVREQPLIFQKASIKDLISDILNQLKDIPNSSRSLTAEQKDRLQRQACKAAIKAGQHLSEIEVKQLLQDFINSPQNFTCPHGRPLYIHFDKHRLESLFMRV